MTEHLSQHIEALIFTAEQPITLKEIKNCLQETFQTKFKKGEVEEATQGLMKKYEEDAYSFEIIEIAEGYQFLTKGAYHNTVGTMLKQKTKKRLSRAALETLSIIAYKQPVTKSEMEKIRGVSCDYSIQKLLEKELVAIAGRSEGPGRPLLYATSEKFMDYFGIKSIKDLPKLQDFKTTDNEIGEAGTGEEVVAQAAADNTSPPTVIPQEGSTLEKEATSEEIKTSDEETSNEKTTDEEITLHGETTPDEKATNEEIVPDEETTLNENITDEEE